jgi:hypothetical protein
MVRCGKQHCAKGRKAFIEFSPICETFENTSSWYDHLHHARVCLHADSALHHDSTKKVSVTSRSKPPLVADAMEEFL